MRVLAGPIVRRVEPRLACVWVALDEACTVTLQIFSGPQSAAALPQSDFSATAPSLRIQGWLHIALVTIELSEHEAIFEPERVYSYQLQFRTATGTHDLRTLHLLEDRTGPRPHLALGYQTDALPTFALPPRQLTDLRILHTSCRRASCDAPDALRWIDDQIRDTRADARRRPHQLFLTGDQIYADDISRPMLAALMQACAAPSEDLTEHLPTRFALEPGQNGVRLFPGNAQHFPPGLRMRLTLEDARFTSSDGDSHLLTLGEFCAMHVFSWANEAWPETLPSADDLYRPLTAMPPEIWRLHTGLKDNEYKLAAINQKLEEQKKNFEIALRVMQNFRDGLPKVRRALANVPVYMIFDDHEITDDWNFSRIWLDRVYTSPLGRTVVRNGMVAYTVCQGWGNDPRRFSQAGPNRELLELIPSLFPEGETLPPKLAPADRVDMLLGLNGERNPLVRWHYSVPGERHLAVVLDVRTRRTFRTRIAPPGNLSDEALKEQLPALPLAPNIEALVLVSSLTVLGPPIFDALFAPLAYRIFDAANHGNQAAIPGMNPDAIEAWPNDEVTWEKLLEALAPYQKVVILSGDVHYSASVGMSYWKKRDAVPARFAQFISSGSRNQFKDVARNAAQSFAFLQKAIQFGASPERLGYQKSAGNLLTFPAGQTPSAALDRRLQNSPALLPTIGWPDGTKENPTRPPDFAWRAEVVVDTRPDAQRPQSARPAPLAPDVPLTVDGYRQVAARHAKQLDNLNHNRQITFACNYGVISFENNHGLAAVQELMATHPQSLDPNVAEVFVRHVISLTAPAGQAPRIGDA